MFYNSRERLDQWKAHGVYPAIHNQIFNSIVENAIGQKFVDVGCCYGLLAERIRSTIDGSKVWGVDRDAESIEMGLAAGIKATLLVIDLNEVGLQKLLSLVSQEAITVVVARRVFSELFARDFDLGRRFAKEARAAGVRELFIQGRVDVPDRTHPLYNTDREVELFTGAFRVAGRAGPVAYLKAKSE